MARPQVTVLQGDVAVQGLEFLQDLVDLVVVDADGLPAALPSTQALFLWDFFSDAAVDLVARAPRLTWVHVAAAGVDRLVTPELAASGVVVTNAHGVFDRRIAEYVLACVSAHLKDLPTTWQDQAGRRWRTRETTDLAGRTVLVVGAGGVGRACARLLGAVGMNCRLLARTARSDPEHGQVLGVDELSEAVGEADVVVVAAPLTAQTEGLVSRQVIARMRPGSFLVNVGRGRTVDQTALTDALLSGHLAGAALDTFQVEPLPPQDPLWDLPQVLVSPHTSSRTGSWRADLVAQFRRLCARWVAGETLHPVVDPELGFVPAARTAPPGG
ncbi:D-2-hydroxyacid dehydrogenase [Auraticoccus monumenti]|uniref:Phosphoglycerate dehydrogenase n=1 Tax=Auraticoccus monumenti TaxID=675864 RepID=A0A1G7EZP9_9ACTN|nr:D-2-hydroxyacid dehydrogenase [Auraticoccus monumenti]SDE69047.1 Phosphoglycerate dehydrogenase [Auraticoccus monumenti]